MTQNDKYFKSYFNVPRKLTYSYITGTSPADFGIDTTRLERLKAELDKLQTETLPNEEKYLEIHEGYYAENFEQMRWGRMDPKNVEIERVRVVDSKARIKDLKENQIPAKKAEIREEEQKIDAQLQRQIELLREKAKTDPAALAALKELEAQQAAISGKKTRIIVFSIAGLIILIIAGFLLYRKLKKAKAVA